MFGTNFSSRPSIKTNVFALFPALLLRAWAYVWRVILCEIGRRGAGWTSGAKGRTAVQLRDGELGQMTGLLGKHSLFQIDGICD